MYKSDIVPSANSLEEYISFLKQKYSGIRADNSVQSEIFAYLKEHQDDSNYLKYMYLVFGNCYDGELGFPFTKEFLLNEFIKLADKGFVLAYNNAGYFLAKVDKKKSDEYFKLAVKHGDYNGLYNLAISAKNEGDEQTFKKYILKGAKKKNLKCLYALARLSIEGDVFEKDISKAMQIMEDLAGKNYLMAKAIIGESYFYGKNGLEEDKAKGFKLISYCASQGNRFSIELMIDIYSFGEYVKPNPEHAFKWIQYAIGKRYYEFYDDLGNAYYFGLGVEKDLKKAYETYEEGYMKYHQYNCLVGLARMFQKGDYVEKNEKVAVDSYKKAFEKGVRKGAYELGNYYYEKGDYNLSVEWFVKGRYFGPAASTCFSRLKDYKRAFEYASKDYENGNYRYSYIIGLLYAEGKYLPKDVSKAPYYIIKSAKLHSYEAIIYLSQGLLYGIYGFKKCINDGLKWLYSLVDGSYNYFDDYVKGKGYYYLGEVYSDTTLPEINDIKKAKQYYEKAYSFGIKHALDRYKQVLKENK